MLAQGVPLERPNSEGRNFLKVFLEHRLVERDEIWHGDWHWCVAGLKGFW